MFNIIAFISNSSVAAVRCLPRLVKNQEFSNFPNFGSLWKIKFTVLGILFQFCAKRQTSFLSFIQSVDSPIMKMNSYSVHSAILAATVKKIIYVYISASIVAARLFTQWRGSTQWRG